MIFMGPDIVWPVRARNFWLYLVLIFINPDLTLTIWRALGGDAEC